MVVIVTGTAQGYENSIYTAYPPIFWILLLLIYSCGVIILILNFFGNQNIMTTSLGIIAIGVYYTIMEGLRTLRGYPFADPQDLNIHISYVEEITSLGHISNIDFYPGMHIIVAIFKEIVGIEFDPIALILSMCCTLIYIFGVYIFSSNITGNKGIGLLSTIFASIPLFGYGYYLHPNIMIALLIPLILYIGYNCVSENSPARSGSRVVFIILTVLIIFFHPMTTIFLIIVLVGQWAFSAGLSKSFKRYLPFTEGKRKNNSMAQISIILIVTIVFSFWYLNFSKIRSEFSEFFQYVLLYQGESTFDVHIGLVSQSGLNIYQLIELYIKLYGALTIFLFPIIIIFFIFLISLYYQSLRGLFSKNQTLLKYMIIFSITICFSTILYFTQTAEADIIRVLRVPIILGTLLNGIISYKIIALFRSKNLQIRIITTLIIAFVIIASALSTFNFYTSPWISKPNYQVTSMEQESVKWSLNHIPVNNTIYFTHITAQHIQKRYFYPNEWGKKNLFKQGNYIPDRYRIDPSANQEYILTGEKDLLFRYNFPERLWDRLSRSYSLDDLQILNSNPRCSCIYDSKECSIWKTSW